jgi:competence protein ComEC
MWWLLDVLAATPWAQWTQHVPPSWTVAVAMVGALWMLLPRGFPARGLGAAMMAPLLLVKPDAPRTGEYWLTLLDVGQGLAAVVRTESHTLVYDTGPRFSESFDSGDAVVMPFLRHLGVRRVDQLILSHSDSDHVGGTRSVLNNVGVDEVRSSMTVPDAPGARPCEAPDAWEWDGVRFELIYPTTEARARPRKDNDLSCVLRVRAPGGTVLLTGDIEANSEQVLIEREGNALRADVLVVPHHGSATSSTAAFVRAVNPRYALFPTGYRNRFGFPKEAVTRRYRDAEAILLDTANRGAITLRVGPFGVSAPESHRLDARRYWTHQAGGKLELKD